VLNSAISPGTPLDRELQKSLVEWNRLSTD
jgi:hypothetical protein